MGESMHDDMKKPRFAEAQPLLAAPKIAKRRDKD